MAALASISNRVDDYRHIIVHKEILAQLKDVAKRIHVTANSLENMAIKVVWRPGTAQDTMRSGL